MQALLFAVLVTSCSSSSPISSMNINANGGSVKTADGTSVSVPAGALANTTAITIMNEPNTVTIGGVVLVGPAYRFGPEGTQFSLPVTVTVAYDPSRLPAGATASDIVVMTAPVGSSDFVPLATSIADATHVSATTTHFSDCVATAPKSRVVDQGVPMDEGTLTDQGPSPSDQASPDDQSLPADAASSNCPHSWLPVQCYLSAIATTCGGSFSLNCQQTLCVCAGGSSQKTCPKPSPYTNTTTCPPQADVETIWTSCCGFP